MAVQVTAEVLEGLEAARDSANHNMFDVASVQNWLFLHGYPLASEWLANNKDEYTHGIFEGFEATS